MNRNVIKQIAVMVSLGGVLLALRLWLYGSAVDEKNLLISGHWLSLVIWAAAALGLALALIWALGSKETGSIAVTGWVCALGEGLLAGAICLSVLYMGQVHSTLEILRNAAAYLAAAGLLYGAYCRATGKTAFFGCYSAVCLFFVLYLVTIYRLWSSNPQLMDYFFCLMACVALTLLSYQNAALSVGIGSRRVWLASGLVAVCFGIAAASGAEAIVLYLGGAVWALTNLMGADAAPRNRHEEGER